MEDFVRGAPVADESLPALFSRVVADAEQVARAEIDLQKAKLVAKVDEAKVGVALGAVAAALASLASFALVIGAVLTLAPLVGPLLATVIVVVVLLLAAGLCGWLAARHFKAMFAPAGAKP